ncbi:hypothetical protein FRACYDRAFT_259325 [Fragilariopsis cylindrus CCMP1102]|uniref:Uncharacterized protein n=1 Tax=Fragilariopsis cylindrus CCMP1102 TaxID=635003 RepID=A0A1E7FYG8_9STRA|nr:hypothetical protein FRACYDRAFT_259325 [Fragilariopsis cylindrus CCMP1102]|eukprot:OEU23185.1 hypothetical protein FRACYDRAFT_259325 [Fragilariopsis cylindrus CCMP1102]
MGQVCSGAKEESTKGGPLDLPSDHNSSDQYSGGDNNKDVTDLLGGDSNIGDPMMRGGAGGIGSDGETNNTQINQQQQQGVTPVTSAEAAKVAAVKAEEERRKRKELWIVNGAARGMVAVRSTRGSTGYYDQGFAGLLAQHLEQTTSFPNRLPLVLPPPPSSSQKQENSGGSSGTSSNDVTSAGGDSNTTTGSTTTTSTMKTGTSVFDRLAQPPWDGLDLLVLQQQLENDNINIDNHTSSSTQQNTAATGSGAGGATTTSAGGVAVDPNKLMDTIAESLLDGPYTVLPAKQQLFAGVKPMVENLL